MDGDQLLKTIIIRYPLESVINVESCSIKRYEIDLILNLAS